MFKGFSQQSVDFLWGIRFNNERDWFETHKEEYQKALYEPMKELCRGLYEGFEERHGEVALTSRVCRIYRDARRLHGRGPYKDHLWLTLSPPVERWAAAPAFWFELSPDGYSHGVGYWMAQALTMAKFRARMDRDPKPMEKLARQIQRQDTFVLSGEDFKRPKRAPSALLEPWYNKKNGFSLSCDRPHDDLIFSPALPGELLDQWEKLIPLFRYLSTLDGDPDPRGM